MKERKEERKKYTGKKDRKKRNIPVRKKEIYLPIISSPSSSTRVSVVPALVGV